MRAGNISDPVSPGAQRGQRGQLTIFLGAMPGVGKTFAMLQAAHERFSEGVDVVAGWVDTHGLEETEALLEGLPTVSPCNSHDWDVSILEMDVQTVLQRRPEIVLVDDLAHRNAGASGNVSRSEDVETLIDAGISVYGTLNVSHLDSLRDDVARITGVRVEETVPDGFVENADVIQLVDISAGALARRLLEGKIYLPFTTEEAVETFYRPESINALRELALMSAFRRLEHELLQYRLLSRIEEPAPMGANALTRLGFGPFGRNAPREGRRKADELQLIPTERVPITGTVRKWWLQADGPAVADYLAVAALLVLVTFLGKVTGRIFTTTDIAMLYLIPVIYAGARTRLAISIATSVVSVLCFDFMFVQPLYRITVSDAYYLMTFGVFLLVAVTTSVMANHLKRQVHETNLAMSRTRALFNLSNELAAVSDIDDFARTVAYQVSKLVDSDTVVYLPSSDSGLELVAVWHPSGTITFGEDEGAVALWVYGHGQEAIAETDRQTGVKFFLVPLKADGPALGVLGIRMEETQDKYFSLAKKDLLRAIAGLVTLALNKLLLFLTSQRVRNLEESERLRNALFDSISHDLRTPLSSIIGAVTSLTTGQELYNAEQREVLLQTIDKGALRMDRLVRNLLDMARLQSGSFRLNEDWCDIEDIIGVAIAGFSGEWAERSVNVDVQASPPLIKADSELLIQVLANLIDNAIKYSPEGSEVEIEARSDDSTVVIRVGDRGPGVSSEDKTKIFDKFYRLQTPRRVSGTGLGLSICKEIVNSHGGSIWVEDRQGGGSTFVISLPVELLRPEDLLDESEVK